MKRIARWIAGIADQPLLDFEVMNLKTSLKRTLKMLHVRRTSEVRAEEDLGETGFGRFRKIGAWGAEDRW